MTVARKFDASRRYTQPALAKTGTTFLRNEIRAPTEILRIYTPTLMPHKILRSPGLFSDRPARFVTIARPGRPHTAPPSRAGSSGRPHTAWPPTAGSRAAPSWTPSSCSCRLDGQVDSHNAPCALHSETFRGSLRPTFLPCRRTRKSARFHSSCGRTACIGPVAARRAARSSRHGASPPILRALISPLRRSTSCSSSALCQIRALSI